MKMVSQLTRQAMSRHRLISAAPCMLCPPSSPSPQPAPFCSPPLPPDPPAPQSAQPPLPPHAPYPVPPQPALSSQRTIYGQLMKKHDRFTERHIPRL